MCLRIILTLAVLTSLLFNAYSQSANDSNLLERKGFFKRWHLNDTVINNKTAEQELEKCPIAFPTYRKGKKQTLIGSILAGSGIVILLLTRSNRDYSYEESSTFFRTTGLALSTTGLVFVIIGETKKKKAIKLRNQNCRY